MNSYAVSSPQNWWRNFTSTGWTNRQRSAWGSNEDIIRADRHWVWLNPEPIPNEMLGFFAHYYRPRIYIIDTNYMDGGLLLMHRDDGRRLRADWIRPTLNNLNRIWKAPVYLLSKDKLYSASANGYKESTVPETPFEAVAERLSKQQQPFKAA